MPGPEGPLDGLPDAFEGERTTEGSALASVEGDASALRGRPCALVRPKGVGDVELLVRWARAHRRPLVARGGGTSLNGESVPSDGAVVVDLSGWRSIGELEVAAGTVRVAPGVVNRDLQEHLAGSGWFFPPNPGSWRSSTIGGNIATNASGPRSLRYGATRRWVREVEAVLGTGERVRVGSSLPKRSVGPDLVGLFVGSEGTLGILTGATLALAPAPVRRLGLALPVPPGHSLSAVASGILRATGLGLSALEYLDATCAEALSRVPGSRLSGEAALLLAESESSDEAEETERLERWAGLLPALGLSSEPTVYPDADRLWTLRGESGTTLDAIWGARVREDVVVPVARLDEMLREVDRVAERFGVRTIVYGHLGEGNLHPNLVIDPLSTRGRTARAALLEAARRLGGSVSGEHGIGAVKRDQLIGEVGAPMLRTLRAVKAACDPDGILNPGKLLPEE